MVSRTELIFRLYLSSIDFLIVCVCEIQSSLLPKEWKQHVKNGVFTSDQNVSKNALTRLPFPGDVSLGILFKASNIFFFPHSRALENVWRYWFMSYCDKCFSRKIFLCACSNHIHLLIILIPFFFSVDFINFFFSFCIFRVVNKIRTSFQGF